MVEQLEDRSYKRLTDKFPAPMLKYLRYQYEMLKAYKTTIELDNTKQYLDYVIQIYEDVLANLEFHSTVLTFKPLGRYGSYRINLRIDSKKYVHQTILCTGDPVLSKRYLDINELEMMGFDIVFTLEDDADEKIKILEDAINNNRKISNTDIEVIYLTVALYMKSTLSKSELLLKIADLTNQVEGLTDDEKKEIKIFQKAFMKKFISDDDELKGEIDKMIQLDNVEIMKELFPEESELFGQERRESGVKDVARNMKDEGFKLSDISKVTNLPQDKIEKL